MDINNIDNIKIIALFFEGMLSFFSPCIIPIIPIYISILTGKKIQNDKNFHIDKINVFINSLFFIVGVSTTFFIIAFTTSYISFFLNNHIKTVQIFSGILIVIMGFVQIGVFNISYLKKEFSFKNKIKNKIKNINAFIAFLMGFTFSFSWTPCIGPIMASVILYASSHTSTFSFILILIYSLGFIFPFILMTIFTTSIMNFIKKYPKFLNYTVVISGIILIIIGVSILTGNFQQLIIKYFI